MGLERAAMTSRHDAKTAKARKKVQDRRNAYWLVDMRDKGCCRACGKVTMSAHPDRTKRREHHHIKGRQIRQAETTSNICLLCCDCHDLRHVKRTLIITGNADGLLTFELDGKTWDR
jgi:hypothetical protein